MATVLEVTDLFHTNNPVARPQDITHSHKVDSASINLANDDYILDPYDVRHRNTKILDAEDLSHSHSISGAEYSDNWTLWPEDLWHPHGMTIQLYGAPQDVSHGHTIKGASVVILTGALIQPPDVYHNHFLAGSALADVSEPAGEFSPPDLTHGHTIGAPGFQFDNWVITASDLSHSHIIDDGTALSYHAKTIDEAWVASNRRTSWVASLRYQS